MRAMQSIEESLKKKNTTKIENSNTENTNWTLTVVNKCLTLGQIATVMAKPTVSDKHYKHRHETF